MQDNFMEYSKEVKAIKAVMAQKRKKVASCYKQLKDFAKANPQQGRTIIKSVRTILAEKEGIQKLRGELSQKRSMP